MLLVAPTGRAARRMAESTGLDASTVHAALGWVPGQGPTVDELIADVLIVDETSMANLELLVTLLRAVGPRTHVVLVGDADQLAPVGAGKPFAELVEAGAVPVTELTHIFRQAAGSMIVRGAHAVRQGGAPSFAAEEGLTRDLFLVERADPAQALEEVVSLVSERLPEHYGVDPVADIQVFAPVYRGALGIDVLNERLRAVLNPDGRPVLGGRLRTGDKLMLSGRNLHDLGLMNGTVLRLLEHDPDGETLTISAEGLVLALPEEEAPGLRLAYACSVHRGQGIELPVAVLIAHPAAGAFFLRREMLYTAMTRATQATVVVGTRAVVARAAATPDTSRRHGRLGERLARPGQRVSVSFQLRWEASVPAPSRPWAVTTTRACARVANGCGSSSRNSAGRSPSPPPLGHACRSPPCAARATCGRRPSRRSAARRPGTGPSQSARSFSRLASALASAARRGRPSNATPSGAGGETCAVVPAPWPSAGRTAPRPPRRTRRRWRP